VDDLLKLAINESEDARKVLNCANLNFTAQRKLIEAIADLVVALAIDNKLLRDVAITAAIQDLDAGRNDIRF
jgi:hypothetical protein